VSRFIYCYAECHYNECRYAECHYAESRYAECHYAECRGGVIITLVILRVILKRS
jgi:hypothetical protein